MTRYDFDKHKIWISIYNQFKSQVSKYIKSTVSNSVQKGYISCKQVYVYQDVNNMRVLHMAGCTCWGRQLSVVGYLTLGYEYSLWVRWKKDWIINEYVRSQ